MSHRHATCGQQVATAPVTNAEARSGGLHTAAQVAQAPQAGPHQALTQVSMLLTSLMLCFHIAGVLALLLSCTSCHYVGVVFVKHLHCC